MPTGAQQNSLPPLSHDNDVVVISVRLDGDDRTLESLTAILSTDELTRAKRFRFEKDRRAFIAARALLRICVAHYMQIKPENVAFNYSLQGKPQLDPVRHPTSLQFNLSHTDGLAAIAFSRTRRVGIDVEQTRRVVDEVEIAERYFSAAEAARLRSLPEAERRFAFLCCWTRKEAYAKATGRGLSETLEVKGSEEEFTGARTTAFSFHPLSLDPDYVGVVAVEGDVPSAQHVRFDSINDFLDVK